VAISQTPTPTETAVRRTGEATRSTPTPTATATRRTDEAARSTPTATPTRSTARGGEGNTASKHRDEDSSSA
jgi:hypothetical protein